MLSSSLRTLPEKRGQATRLVIEQRWLEKIVLPDCPRLEDEAAWTELESVDWRDLETRFLACHQLPQSEHWYPESSRSLDWYPWAGSEGFVPHWSRHLPTQQLDGLLVATDAAGWIRPSS